MQDFELGGKQDGSWMIVCESTLTHVSVCVPTRGVWGHARGGAGEEGRGGGEEGDEGRGGGRIRLGRRKRLRSSHI